MEVDALRTQLTSLLALHHDDDASDDDIVFATLDYIHGAHTAAQVLLLEGRFPELQWCLNLCQAALGELFMSPVAAAPAVPADATSEEGAAAATPQGTSDPLSRRMKAVGSKRRRASLALCSDENHRIFSALARRTAQLQTQMEAAMLARQGCDADCPLHQLDPAVKSSDADEALVKREVMASIRFFQWQLQQLPRAAPMALPLQPAFHHEAWSRSTQMSDACLPPPVAPRSAPAQGERGRSAPFSLPSLSMPEPCASTRQHATSTASVARLGIALPPPSPPVRGITMRRKPYANQWKAPKCLPPLVTEGRAFYMDLCQTYDVASDALHHQLQSNNHVDTPASENGDLEKNGSIRAAQQLYGTLNRDSNDRHSREALEASHLWSSSGSSSSSSSNWGLPPSSAVGARTDPTAPYHSAQLVSRITSVNGEDKHEEEEVESGSLVGGGGDVQDETSGQGDFSSAQGSPTQFLLRTTSPLLESDAKSPVPTLTCSSPCADAFVRDPTVSAFTSGSHVSHPEQPPSNLVGAFSPRRRLLPVSTSALAMTSSVTNAMASSARIQRKVSGGVPSDDAHVATSTTAVASLPSLTGPPAMTSTAAARAVQDARQTMQFAMTSLKAQHQRSAQVLEQCDELALSRLPYSARKTLMASRAGHGTHQYVTVNRNPDDGGGENSVRSAPPVSVCTTATQNGSPTAVHLTDEQVLPSALPSVDAAAVATAELNQLQHLKLASSPPLFLSQSQELSPDAEAQLGELRAAREQQLAASESNVQEMEAQWLAQHRQLRPRVALPRSQDVSAGRQSFHLYGTQRTLHDLQHRWSSRRHPAEQGSHVDSPSRGHTGEAAPMHTTSAPPSPPHSLRPSGSPPCTPTSVTRHLAAASTTVASLPIVSTSNTSSDPLPPSDSSPPLQELPLGGRGARAAVVVKQQGDDQREDDGAASPALKLAHAESVSTSGASKNDAKLLDAAKTMWPVGTALPSSKRATQTAQEDEGPARAMRDVLFSAVRAQLPQQARHHTSSEAVEASEPSAVEETLVAWRRMLQAMNSMPTTMTVVHDSGTEVQELNVAPACLRPLQNSCCLAITAVAPPPTRANSDAPRARHSIRCATAVVRGRSTQRFVCEALRQVSQPVHPVDLVHSVSKTGSPARPQPPAADFSNVLLTGMDAAEVSAEAPERAVRRSSGSTTRVMGLLSDSSTCPSASTDAPAALNSVLPCLSQEAVTSVLRQVNATYRTNAVLLSIEDWTAVSPDVLSLSLPLSVRAVRIQKWWRQRLAIRVCRQRREAQQDYLVEEERRDAAALRVQGRIRGYWAQKALAHRAAAAASLIERRVAAEWATAKYSVSVDDLTDGSVASDASSSLTPAPSSNHHLCLGMTSEYAVDSSHTALQPFNMPAHAGTTPGGADKDTSIFFRSARAAVAADNDDRHISPHQLQSPSTVTATETDATMTRTATAQLSVHRNTASEHQKPSTKRPAEVLQKQPGLVSASAQRIQRCYRRHLARLQTARLCREVEVLSAVVTQRAPLAAVRMTLTAEPLSAVAAASLMKQRSSERIYNGVGELSDMSPSSASGCSSSHSPSSATLSTAALARELNEGSDTEAMRSLLNRCTGDVYESFLQRGLAARRHGDYKTPLERVSLRALQSVRQKHEDEVTRQRQRHELEQRRKLEQQRQRERQVLEASKTIQRIGRAYRWRRWLCERGLKARRRSDHPQVSLLSFPTVKGIHSVPHISSDGEGVQPVRSSEDEQYLQLAGGEAVTSHISLRLQAMHPQWFGIAADPTSAQYIAEHCTPAQLATVPIIEAFVAAFASSAEVYNRYRHACAKSLQLAWRLHRAKRHSRRKQG
ncbi:hypothetical protein, conserved [Leishmania tarentolae]|uniref:Uncharacterized protein n=1 Tax=Leishmania tarentolae TaxID=5689 RepID=A0A640KE23_LEITA|nr:hypothetical protein, conserved [Leishmania tarentolae]